MAFSTTPLEGAGHLLPMPCEWLFPWLLVCLSVYPSLRFFREACMWRLPRCPASQVQGTAFPFWLFRDLSRNTGLSAPLSRNTDLCFHSLLLRFQPPTLRDAFVSLGKKRPSSFHDSTLLFPKGIDFKTP